MATKKDLVEAYSFSRRRLVTAFVSGAPGGREVEPSRPGRTLVGGLALAVLVAAGGAVAGILGSHESVDWTKPALVSDKDSFAVYVVLPTADPGTDAGTDPAAVAAPGTDDAQAVLRPVANITSAMLLLGPDLQHEVVSGAEIATQKRGAPIGIQQAPPTPPAADALVQTGWTACTGRPDAPAVGVHLALSTTSGTTPAPAGVMLFHADGSYYLAAEVTHADGTTEAYAYLVPRTPAQGNLLYSLARLKLKDAVETTADFVSLFHRGPALGAGSFSLEASDLSEPAPYARAALGARAQVGDLYTVPGDPQPRVLLRDGPAPLSPFAAQVYQSAFGRSVRLYRGVQGPEPELSQLDPYDATTWPGAALPLAQVGGDNCVVLDTSIADQPRVHLATSPTAAASAGDVPRGQHTISVDTGHGAVVRSGAFADGAFDPTNVTPFLVDDRGYAYQLDENAGDQLGYAAVPPVDVPDAWRKLLSPGVSLSVNAARCPPTTDPKAAPCGT